MLGPSRTPHCGLSVEQISVEPELVVQLYIRILEWLVRRLPYVTSPRTHLEAHTTGAPRSQTPFTIHTHHSRPVPTRRIVTHGPSQVELRDMFSDLSLQLYLNTCVPECPTAGRTRRPRG